jgi:hypothetical protein
VGAGLPAALPFAAAGIAATVTAFLSEFSRLIVRLSSHDVSARAFSWSTRSILLVAVAVVGLLLVLNFGLKEAVLLGILAGAMGHHAITLLLDKAPKMLGLAHGAAIVPSPLLALGGIRAEHAARLEEEGIVTVEDLAFVPTARLYFNTAFGLQTICEWQDQALLVARLGPERVADLFRQMGIRLMTDLARTARDVLDAPGSAETAAVRDALHRVLKLEKEAPLDPVLRAVAADQTLVRLQQYRRSVVLEPAQFEEPAQVPAAVPAP